MTLNWKDELFQPMDETDREPLEPGCWVVVAPSKDWGCLSLGIVSSGPDYNQIRGQAFGEVWTLTDGTRHPVGMLTRIDLVEIIRDAASATAAILATGRDPNCNHIRVVRAAILARHLLSRGPTKAGVCVPNEQWGQLVSLILADDELLLAAKAWGAFVRSLPVLVKNLANAGAMWASRDPNWTPGEGVPHPGLEILK